MDEFEHNLLGMQDYVRWAKRFEHRCAEITPAFWAQVNMHDLMYAYELEMDQNTFTRTNTGNEVQDVTNKQFMQEKQWAISTAQQLLPLTWLRQALRPMFYMLY